MNERFTPGLNSPLLTPFYDTCAGFLGLGGFLRRVVRAIQAAGAVGNESVLDVGCGTGTLLIKLKMKFPSMAVAGTDPDRKMLQIAGKKLKRSGLGAELRHGFVQHLPFPDSSFDIVTCTLVFHHLPEGVKRRALKELYRVLKPAGFLLLADFAMTETAIGKAFIGLVGRFGYKPDRDHGQLPAMLEEAGFRAGGDLPMWRGVEFLLARPGK